jgi:hypothetical protein
VVAMVRGGQAGSTAVSVSVCLLQLFENENPRNFSLLPRNLFSLGLATRHCCTKQGMVFTSKIYRFEAYPLLVPQRRKYPSILRHCIVWHGIVPYLSLTSLSSSLGRLSLTQSAFSQLRK